MIFSRYRTGVAAIALGLAGALPAFAAPQAVDQGSFIDAAGDQSITVTIALKLRDPAGAETLMQHLSTPGDALFQNFLTPQQVAAQFGPSQASIDSTIANLRLRGLQVEQASATTLQATGSASTLERVFQTSLHQFLVPAAGSRPAYSYRAPTTLPVVPAEIAPAVHGVLGLNTAPAFHANHMPARSSFGGVAVPHHTLGTATTNPPGLLTVVDFAQLYDVNPLYAKGVTGKGTTLAIVTLAGFTPSDVFTYWQSLNLTVDPNRLTVVNIDGGPGAPSDASGSSETTLDVEQSGGVAPGAKIIVYESPNTNQGFLDDFVAAVRDNKAETFSTSWGQWEFLDNLANGPVTDPFTGETVSSLQAIHEVLLEAALQGQSVFDAAGDDGAFDEFGELPSNFSTPLSVDYPASDTAITTGGGTTLPGTQSFGLPDGSTLNINVPTQRVWGWDYLQPLCTALNLDQAACGIFPVGTGGGVSVFFGLPFYQFGLAGVQTSQPGQNLVDNSTTPPTTVFALPAHFRGRNVPDASFNADPDTGYIIPYTSDVNGVEVLTFFGGTSFVAPQLNGVTALLNQNAGHRFGLLNPLLYTLEQLGGDRGRNPVFNDIPVGDNWFYTGRNGYSPTVGVGTIDVSELARLAR